MATAALVGYIVGVLLCFGWRTWHQRRETGDAGFRRPTYAAGSPGWWASTLLAVALLLGLAGPVLAVLNMPAPIGTSPLSEPVATILGSIGAAVAVSGLVLALLSQATMGASWRIGVDADERTCLVDSGPFAWSRNPFFTALVIAQLGLTAMTPNLVQVLALAMLIIAIELQVRGVEEPYLLATHDCAYRAYGHDVGRFVPGIGRLTNACDDDRAPTDRIRADSVHPIGSEDDEAY